MEDFSDLNRQQKEFCRFYVANKNATKAAALAGYSKENAARQGFRLLHTPKCKKYIDYLDETNTKIYEELSAIATKQEVLEFFTRIMRTRTEKTGDRIKAATALGEYYDIATGEKESEVTALDKIVNAIQNANNAPTECDTPEEVKA